MKEKIAKNPGLLQVLNEMLSWGLERPEKREDKNSDGKAQYRRILVKL